MPTSGKLFIIVEKMSLEDIREALTDYDVSEEFSTPELNLKIRENIENLAISEEPRQLMGQFSQDNVSHLEYRGTVKATPFTTYAPFIFFEQSGQTYCLIMASKVAANKVAGKLSEIAFGEQGAILEPLLDIPRINKFYRDGQRTSVLLLDNMEVPNLGKLTMYGGKGGDVVQTDLFGRYIQSGDPWYVVFKEKITGETVGLVRDGTIVIFGNMEGYEYIKFVKEYILPLVLRRKGATINEGPKQTALSEPSSSF